MAETEKPVIVDTYEYIPSKPIDTVDSDLKPSDIKKNVNIKEVE